MPAGAVPPVVTETDVLAARLPGANVTLAEPSKLVTVPPEASTTPDPGGDGPLPGTAAGSVGARSAEVGVDAPLPSIALVAESPLVVLVPPEPPALDVLVVAPAAALSEPSEPDVAATPLVPATVAVVDSDDPEVSTVAVEDVAVSPSPACVTSRAETSLETSMLASLVDSRSELETMLEDDGAASELTVSVLLRESMPVTA